MAKWYDKFDDYDERQTQKQKKIDRRNKRKQSHRYVVDDKPDDNYGDDYSDQNE